MKLEFALILTFILAFELGGAGCCQTYYDQCKMYAEQAKASADRAAASTVKAEAAAQDAKVPIPRAAAAADKAEAAAARAEDAAEKCCAHVKMMVHKKFHKKAKKGMGPARLHEPPPAGNPVRGY